MRMSRLVRCFILPILATTSLGLLLYTITGSTDHTPHRPQHQIVFKQPANRVRPSYKSSNQLSQRPLLNGQAKHFPFKSNFSFPQPRVMKPLTEIDSSKFLHDLRKFLLGYKSDKPLALITSNEKYVDVLLNWLICATVRSGLPLDSIVVFSLDTKIHALLTKRGIPSILTFPSELIRQDFNFNTTFEEIMMVRLAVMRMVSHFGFDVVMYDTDAIILKDPQPLYDHLHSDDIIGSVGRIPYDLLAEWGITICIGVVLIRSSPSIENYWNSMKDICVESVDDQTKLNCGLKALNIRWTNNDTSFYNTTVQGATSNGLVSVSILQYDLICRKEKCVADKRKSYYIWHKGGERSFLKKLAGARDGQTWFLQYQWQLLRNNLMGIKWLESICYPGVTHG